MTRPNRHGRRHSDRPGQCAGEVDAAEPVAAATSGFTIISVNYSNKQPFLYWQGNLACAGVPSPRAVVTAQLQTLADQLARIIADG